MEAAAAKAVREAQGELDTKVLAKYANLSETDIKLLVVDDKWFTSILAAIEREVQRLTQALAARVTELEERYAVPLPTILDELNDLSVKVEAHLAKMGVALA